MKEGSQIAESQNNVNSRLQIENIPSRNNIEKTSVLDHILFYFGTNHDKHTASSRKFESREKYTFLLLGILVIMFIGSLTGFFVMWFTDVYNDSIIQSLVLGNNSKASVFWMKPPIKPLLKVHIFNYTNAAEYVAGEVNKLRVEDLGPYVYEETIEKVDVTYNGDNTVTYKEKRSFEFLPEASNGKQYDKVVVPNVPMISAMSAVKDSNYMIRFGLRTAFTTVDAEAFKQVPAETFLWGYEDRLISFLKSILGNRDIPFEKFGLLMNRNGTSRDNFTIHTGEEDMKQLAVIKAFNGQSRMNFWSTDECNGIDGTDGSQFPPHMLDKKHTLQVFIKDLCRKFPLVYDKEVTLFEGIPAWRYKAPLNVFHRPDLNPENQCYCHLESGTCPPSGIYNATMCNYGAPIHASFPHFYLGEPSLLNSIEGLSPQAELHETFADIHPRLAFPIDGASRFQINIQVQKMDNVDAFSNVENNIILPLIWLEVMPGVLPDSIRDFIYHSTFSANAIHLSLKYGSLLTFVTSFSLLLTLCYFRGKTIKDSEVKHSLEFTSEFEELNLRTANNEKILNDLSLSDM